MKKNQKGFSLIELLVVIAIIGIIVAIAIPNLIAARRSANEGSAMSTIRMLHTAQVTYNAADGNGEYGSLADLRNIILIDELVATGNKSGYNFIATPDNNVTPSTFVIDAAPINVTAGAMRTGTRRFCIATEGVLRANPNNPGTRITAANACNDAYGPAVH